MFTFTRPTPACADPTTHPNGCDCAWVTTQLKSITEDFRPNLQKKYNKIRGEIRSSWPTIKGLQDDNARRVAANQFLLSACK